MAIPIIGKLIDTFADKIIRTKASEAEQLAFISSDSDSARSLQQGIQIITVSWLGSLISALRHGIRIFGGYFAQGIVFFNIIIGNSEYLQKAGFVRVELSPNEYKIILLIITYFYGSRFIEVLTGKR